MTHRLSSSSEEEDDDWCPPLPARTYLTDTTREDVSILPRKADDLLYAATLTSSPQRDAHNPSNSPRLQHFDLLARHHLGTQSNPDLFSNFKAQQSKVRHASQWADDFKEEGPEEGQSRRSFVPCVFESHFKEAAHKQCHALCNLVYDVTQQEAFLHENHVAFSQSTAQCSLVSSKFPEHDIGLMSCQDNLLLRRLI